MAKSDNIIDAVNSFVNSLEEEQKNENILKNKSEQENDLHKNKFSHDRLPESSASKSHKKLADNYGNSSRKRQSENAGNKNTVKTYEKNIDEKPEKTLENSRNINPDKSNENNTGGFERLADIVKNSIELLTMDKAIRVEPDKDKYRISVYGKDLAIVIGKNGTVMDALEYLVNLIGKRKKLVEKNVVIDIKDYRKNNDEKIKEIAINMAKKALKERKNIALRPMPSHERKIVHNILSKVKNIRTKSRDDEPNRRIVIYPVIKE